jgi:hypothetical protein
VTWPVRSVDKTEMGWEMVRDVGSSWLAVWSPGPFGLICNMSEAVLARDPALRWVSCRVRTVLESWNSLRTVKVDRPVSMLRD